jgi:hypothetical protein
VGWNAASVRHVFIWMSGTGVYSSAFLHPSVERALSVNPVAYLTFDKPGIRAPFQDPAAFTVNDNELSRYTQGHMLECARAAMSSAEERFGQRVRFHLRGHSEGTLISLFLYEQLLSEEPALAARVDSLMLSGLSLEPFQNLVERQLSQFPPERSKAIRDAIARCDWPRLKTEMPVSCAYLKDAFARPSGRTVFENIARHEPRARFFVFQGNDDTHTPARYVRELETWNQQTGHLDMKFRYYPGGHVGGPPEVKREVSDLLVKLTADGT